MTAERRRAQAAAARRFRPSVERVGGCGAGRSPRIIVASNRSLASRGAGAVPRDLYNG